MVAKNIGTVSSIPADEEGDIEPAAHKELPRLRAATAAAAVGGAADDAACALIAEIECVRDG